MWSSMDAASGDSEALKTTIVEEEQGRFDLNDGSRIYPVPTV